MKVVRLRNDPWEWKYTAIFSEKFNGEITNASDISQLDHFIYAAKFNPIFPTLIILSLTYLLILSGYLLLRKDTKKVTIFLLSLVAIYVLFGIVVTDSPTIGGRYFTVTFLTIGAINLVAAVLLSIREKNGGLICES
ncbi:DUF4306 domain-containing protein [Paraliobacillus sediminis]|uniref:DUF4306 domain-containing protein n=1 Tax=Paraliobacillus sediminis TaxID=1885916 RepID=UPI0013C3529E|nr:DUF4306 domain-containing protein [Paraliobacillus sediminis]